MKLFTKTTVALTLMAVLGGASVFTAAPARAQITSVDDILNKVREDSTKTAAENRKREAEFRQRRDTQKATLAAARRKLADLNRRALEVQATFNTNQARIEVLEAELLVEQGEFRDVFGLARSQAGEFKATLDNSLITAEYPTRTQILGRIAESKALPNADDLNRIWQTMLGEIKAQRQVKTFSAAVANVEGGAEQDVVRVGPFAVFTKSKGEFLDYTKPSSDTSILLSKLPSQPGGAINAASHKVAQSTGGLVYAPIDPTRGSLLKSFELVPTVVERVGNPFLFKAGHGGNIGLVILWLAMVGIVFGLVRIFMLMMVSNSVNAQKRKAQASLQNPLGRVMLAYDDAKSKDAETVELKLDEAILRESPKLELGLNFLKLGAGIAPLLGLLGTVTGMIKTFQAMMIYGAGDPQLMAGGISEALVTTMLGLIAAIPLLILHSFCASIARGVQGTLEEQSAGIVARHVESRN